MLQTCMSTLTSTLASSLCIKNIFGLENLGPTLQSEIGTPLLSFSNLTSPSGGSHEVTFSGILKGHISLPEMLMKQHRVPLCTFMEKGCY